MKNYTPIYIDHETAKKIVGLHTFSMPVKTPKQPRDGFLAAKRYKDTAQARNVRLLDMYDEHPYNDIYPNVSEDTFYAMEENHEADLAVIEHLKKL